MRHERQAEHVTLSGMAQRHALHVHAFSSSGEVTGPSAEYKHSLEEPVD